MANCKAVASSGVGREDELLEAAPEFGAVDALAVVGEDELLDHVADVRVAADRGRPAARVELEREIYVQGFSLTSRPRDARLRQEDHQRRPRRDAD